jgi:hypothetical protein
MATRYNYTGGIVTNGLVLNLDAAKLDSYPGTGTTWRDISGNNNNGTLTNGPTFSGIGKQAAIVFDGVDDYVNCGNTIFPSGSQNFTISIWVYLKDGVINDYIFSKGSAAAGSAGGGFWMVNGSTYVRFSATDSTPTRSTNVEHGGVSLNTWYNFTYTYDGTTITGYKNAASAVADTSISGPINYVSDPILIGTHRYLGNFPTMDVASFTFYNRALTADEILQNYNATKTRFGL